MAEYKRNFNCDANDLRIVQCLIAPIPASTASILNDATPGVHCALATYFGFAPPVYVT
jgi:hypothetical protein